MSIFSWFSTTASKSNAAALIQTVFETLDRGGILESQPASLANRLTQAAFNRVPHLANTKYKIQQICLGSDDIRHGSDTTFIFCK